MSFGAAGPGGPFGAAAPGRPQVSIPVLTPELREQLQQMVVSVAPPGANISVARHLSEEEMRRQQRQERMDMVWRYAPWVVAAGALGLLFWTRR